MSTQPTVSVVVATRNRLSMLKACVDSLRAQEYPKDFTELVIVDDGSTDETPQYLSQIAANDSRVLVITQPHGWQSEARNKGISRSKGELIAIIDDDCTASENWLSKTVHTMQDKSISAIGGYLHAPGENIIVRFLDYVRALDAALLPNGSPKNIVTANACFRRSVFKKIGLFDDTFAASGGEDSDVSLRMRQAGLKLRFAPAVRVQHWYGPDATDFMRRYYRYGYSNRCVLDKHIYWEYWLPNATEELRNILNCDNMNVREFSELPDTKLRIWFSLLRGLQYFLFLAGYVHLAHSSEIRTAPLPKPSYELTEALLKVLSANRDIPCPNSNRWYKELAPLEQHYWEALRSGNMTKWVRSVFRSLDLDYILKSSITLPVAFSNPNSTLPSNLQRKWINHRKRRSGAYRRRYSQLLEKLSTNPENYLPTEVENKCHESSVGVSGFREWFGETLDQSNMHIMAIWPFVRRKKRPQPSTPSSPPSEGGGFYPY